MNLNSLKTRLQEQGLPWLKKLKGQPLLLPIAGSVALVIAGGLTYWALTRPRFIPGSLPIGAQAIPQDSLLVMTVSTDPGQWRQLRRFGTTDSQKGFDQGIAQVRDRMFTANGLDYERDIQPWVGPVATFALLNPQGEASTPKEGSLVRPANAQPALLILPINDPLRAKEVLAKSTGESKLKWTDRKYNEIEVLDAEEVSPTSGQIGLSIAVVERKYLVIANSPKSIERAIDTFKSDKDNSSIAQTAGYSEALAQIHTGPSFATLYMNLPEMAAAGLQAPKKKEKNVTQGLALVADLQSEGIQFKSVLWLNPESDRKFSQSDIIPTLPNRLPADSIFLTSGANFKQFWTDYTKDYTSNPIKILDPNTFKQGFRSALGMNFEEDFTNWMAGEFALGAVPSTAKEAANTPIGLTLMVQASDRRAADKAFTQLDETMARKYGFKVEASNINNQSVTQWNAVGGAGGINITRGWLENNVAFLTIGAPVASSFLPKANSPLNSASGFQQVLPNQNTAKGGIFFADFDRLGNYNNLPLLRPPEGIKFWMNAIQSLGVRTQVSGDRTTRYDAIVRLKRGSEPGPLPSPTVPATPKPSPSPQLPAKKKP